MQRALRRDCWGFTLIEVLVVIVIVAILASIGLPLAELAKKRQQEDELRIALRQIRTAIDAYKQAGDEGRIERAPDQSGYPPDLRVLFAGVVDAKSPERKNIYFLRQLPRDPFAPIDVPAENTWALRSYASPPDAPAPGEDVFDVHSKSPAKGMNGVPYAKW